MYLLLSTYSFSSKLKIKRVLSLTTTHVSEIHSSHSSAHSTHASMSSIHLHEHLKNLVRINATHSSSHASKIHTSHSTIDVFTTCTQIVLASFFRVAQNCIGLINFLELFLCLRLYLFGFIIFIRVPL